MEIENRLSLLYTRTKREECDDIEKRINQMFFFDDEATIQ